MGEKEETSKKSTRRPRRPYPKDTLEEAIIIPQAIYDENAGRPMKRLLLADAIKKSPSSTDYRDLLSSSRRYGLTIGTQKAEFIELTPLGKSIVETTKVEERIKLLQEATLMPPLFKSIYSYYKEAKLPSEEILKKTLEDQFNIPSVWVDECIKILVTNGRFTQIIREISGSDYIMIGEIKPPVTAEEEKPIEEEKIIEERKEEEISKKLELKAVMPTVFISHSKNKKIVDQIRQILDFGQFEYRIAVERETTAIPIPEKVFSLMRECNCAIINVSADEQEKREDGTYGINQNVLIEIGAAFLLYNKKVILLVDKRIQLPSNLQGLYRSEYEGDELTFSTAMKLQKSLSEFRK